MGASPSADALGRVHSPANAHERPGTPTNTKIFTSLSGPPLRRPRTLSDAHSHVRVLLPLLPQGKERVGERRPFFRSGSCVPFQHHVSRLPACVHSSPSRPLGTTPTSSERACTLLHTFAREKNPLELRRHFPFTHHPLSFPPPSPPASRVVFTKNPTCPPKIQPSCSHSNPLQHAFFTFLLSLSPETIMRRRTPAL